MIRSWEDLRNRLQRGLKVAFRELSAEVQNCVEHGAKKHLFQIVGQGDTRRVILKKTR